LARNIGSFRVFPEWKKPFSEDRLLVLSCFPDGPTRITTDSAYRRNEFVAALADEIFVVHASPGGRLAKLLAKLKRMVAFSAMVSADATP